MKQHFILAIIFSIILTACGGGSDESTVPTTTGNNDGVENIDFNWPAHVIGYKISLIVEGDDTDSPTGIPVGSEVIYEFSEDGAVQGTNPVSGNVYYPDSYSYSVIGNVATIRLTYSATAYEVYELTATSATTGTFYYTGNAGDSRGEMHNWGRYVILSNGAEKSFLYTPSGNQATFEWVSLPDSAYFRLSHDLEGSTSLKTIQDNIVGNSITTTVSPFEYAYREQPLNSYYVIESCNADDECTEYNRITASAVLRDAITIFDATRAVTSDGFQNMLGGTNFSADGEHLFVENADTTHIFHKVNSQEGVWGLQEIVNVSGVFDANGTRLLNETEVYNYVDGNLTLDTNLTVTPENRFHVQKISGDGNTIVLGYAVMISGNPRGEELYIFHKEEGSWVLQERLEYLYRSTYVQGFVDFSISHDGNTLLIADIHSNSQEGAVDVYSRTNNEWVLQYKLSSPGIEKLGMFVSVSSDGTKAVAIDVIYTVGAGTSSTVYLLERDGETGTNWTRSMLFSSELSIDIDIRMSGDGTTFIFGNRNQEIYTLGYDFGANDPQTASGIDGHTKVYRIDYTSKSATFVTKTTQTKAGIGAAYGHSSAISPQGDSIAVRGMIDKIFIH